MRRAIGRWHDGAWQLVPSEQEHWLRYEHPGGAMITNDSAYNAGLSRRLFPVRDFGLSVVVHSSGEWSVSVELENAGAPLSWDVDGSNEMLLEVFAFDRHVEIYLDEQLQAQADLDSDAVLAGSSRPLAVGVADAEMELRNLRIYHDIYHASEAEEFGGPLPMQPVKLGPDEIYVLGDNVPVSIDSRRWGPVPLRLLVGRPIGVR